MMAKSNSQSLLTSGFRLLTPASISLLAPPSVDAIGKMSPAGSDLELDELDIWGCQPDPIIKPIAISRAPLPRRKSCKMFADPALIGPASLPVSIPDWSKMIGGGGDGEEEEEVEEPLTPPHELMWRRRRNRMAESLAFSVEEGVGRTLKGRDLSRLRNAIWEKIGFED